MPSSLLAAFRALPRFGGSDSIGGVTASADARAHYIEGVIGVGAFVFAIGAAMALTVGVFSCCFSPNITVSCKGKRGCAVSRSSARLPCSQATLHLISGSGYAVAAVFALFSGICISPTLSAVSWFLL